MWLYTRCDLVFEIAVPTPFVMMLRPRSGAQQWIASEQYRLYSQCSCYLLPSRYCESDRFGEMANEITAGMRPGYNQVAAIEAWLRNTIRFDPNSSETHASAIEVNARQWGVCRDLSHLVIALCRSLSIPARMVVGYLHGLQSMDLHAWFEAYVGGRWYSFDATQHGMRGGYVAIGCGRDAADVAPAMFGGILLAATYHSFRLTPILYGFILLHCIVLMVGGHYTYAEVPMFDGLFGSERNNYDKVGHFFQGFVPALLAREILIRKRVVNGRVWLAFFVISICLAFSAFYELIEWGVALASGEEAEAFLGTQGYIWDTQSDMGLALVGACCALLLLSVPHNRQIEMKLDKPSIAKAA
jgi:putative membrane protein